MYTYIYIFACNIIYVNIDKHYIYICYIYNVYHNMVVYFYVYIIF